MMSQMPENGNEIKNKNINMYSNFISLFHTAHTRLISHSTVSNWLKRRIFRYCVADRKKPNPKCSQLVYVRYVSLNEFLSARNLLVHDAITIDNGFLCDSFGWTGLFYFFFISFTQNKHSFIERWSFFLDAFFERNWFTKSSE